MTIPDRSVDPGVGRCRDGRGSRDDPSRSDLRSTAAERAATLPGDNIVADPNVVTDHAITIDAPPAAVWPWLVQMGWGRGGWYTARWVDRLLFPTTGRSAERIIPELQDIGVGTFIPDGAAGNGVRPLRRGDRTGAVAGAALQQPSPPELAPLSRRSTGRGRSSSRRSTGDAAPGSTSDRGGPHGRCC